jgi:small-conductance mechanosensitive channel
MSKHIYAGYGLALILFGIFVWIAWFGLQDLIAGFIFRSNSGLNISEQIQIGDVQGSIVKMGYRNLILDTASGNFVSLPYSKIIRQSIIRISSTEIRHSISFELRTAKVENIQKISNDISARIIMHPRSSLTEKPDIELIKEEDNYLIFSVKVFAIETKFLSVIEEDLKTWISEAEK